MESNRADCENEFASYDTPADANPDQSLTEQLHAKTVILILQTLAAFWFGYLIARPHLKTVLSAIVLVVESSIIWLPTAGQAVFELLKQVSHERAGRLPELNE